MKNHPSELREFLSRKLDISKEEMPEPGEWAGSGNTIGSIALRMGLLSLDQIESVVDLQVAEDGRFGDIAVKLGFLSRTQIDRLLRIQDLHRCIDLGGPLVMSGQVALDGLVASLAEFFGD